MWRSIFQNIILRLRLIEAKALLAKAKRDGLNSTRLIDGLQKDITDLKLSIHGKSEQFH